METKIKASDIYFGEFHRKASEVFYIPSLQRPYSWDAKKQVDKFWDDIMENDAPYYIGSIVFVIDGGSAGKDQIIDGQQRLTTLYLTLTALRDFASGLKARESKEFIKKIDNFLIKYDGDGHRVRLSFSNESSNSVYEAIVFKSKLENFNSEVQKKFIKNYLFLKTKITEYCGNGKFVFARLLEIFNKITNLQLIFVECRDKSAAFRLFESINATGIDLSTNDLIKNAILESVYEDKKLLENVESKWRLMSEEFDDNSSLLKTYVRHHWISTVDYTNHSKLFDDFLKKYKSKDEIYEYTQSLFSLAPVYISLRNAGVEGLELLTRNRTDLMEIKENLRFINSLGVDQIYPVLMNLYQNQADKFKKDVIRLAAFQCIYKYIPGSPSLIEKKFANFCSSKINKDKLMSELLSLCKGREKDFVEKVVDKVKYIGGNSVDVQFMLEKYLYFLGKPTKFADPTIEHIIPQDTTDVIYNSFSLEEKDIFKLVNSLGNLTILERNENSDQKIFNQEFHKKYSFYGKSIFTGNKNITKYKFDTSPEEAIRKRSVDIAKQMYKIFIKALETGKWVKTYDIK